MKQEVNISINEGEPFFGHEVTINFTPTQMTLNFKCITPRNDPRSQKPSFQLKHNVVMLEPWHAKAMIDVLTSAISKYESEFGAIEKPESLVKAEEKQKEIMSQAKQGPSTPPPTYMG